jgi:ABC-2 type transport system ATP-binding protein
MTVLLTTHFIEEAERCDELLLLDRGRIVAGGSPVEMESEIGGDVVTVVPRDGSEAFARDLAERFPELAPHLSGDGGGDGDGGVRFEREDAHRFVARLAEAFPGRIDSVTVSRPTLEDVFLRHTGHGLYGEESR